MIIASDPADCKIKEAEKTGNRQREILKNKCRCRRQNKKKRFVILEDQTDDIELLSAFWYNINQMAHPAERATDQERTAPEMS
jgi:hypothetical protein